METYSLDILQLFSDDLSFLSKKDELQVQAAIGKIRDELVTRAETWLVQNEQHHIITFSSPAYPDALRQLPSPPLVLFVTGTLSRLQQPPLAIVGSRRATQQGLGIAKSFATELAFSGLNVISGMAAGIDAAAHQGAVAVEGRTIAVVGTGPDLVYPKRHQALHTQIIEQGGAVISEFWPGMPPRAQHFPRRNRIIAAMGIGTLVVEATIKSGTLITAKMAADLGKDVFAVPGNINNPMTQGCHYLIQQGAKLVTCLDDILEEFSHLTESSQQISAASGEKSEDESLATDKLLASVDYDVTAIDIIAERNALPVSDVLAALLEYELRGLVAAVPGGYVKLRGK
ncbi:DNA-protecting protein DprA [Alteromonas pelagimontana]|uniref:DNA-protecting protein DprA n=2 Tax=Alteromonas pelagimontana TaxID=1858656 RepID=A0A6M4MHY5_9ALTE|nr:DNA-protecting protein DprA [Alteromonas pelagimontana]